MGILNYISNHLGFVGLILSEVIALIPGIKSNSLIQLSVTIVADLAKQLKDKLSS